MERKQSSLGWRQLQTEEEEEGGGEGQMNRDIVRLVKRKQSREKTQRKLCVYVYMRDRQNKQFNIKRQSDRKKGGGVV